MSLEHLWAGWRSTYIETVTDDDAALRADASGSLFERILAASATDEDGFIVRRGAHCFVILNAYPYTNGHVLVMPNRAVAELEDLTPQEHDELWVLVRDAVVAIKAAYRCDGVNVGMNLGRAGGAGVPDHLVHESGLADLPRARDHLNEAPALPEAARQLGGVGPLKRTTQAAHDVE